MIGFFRNTICHGNATRSVVQSLLLAAGLLAAPVFALVPGQQIDNFRLLDHQGNSHELYRFSDRKAIAVLVQGNGCPIVRNAMPRFKELRDQFAKQGVEFVMLNSNLQDNRDNIREEATAFAYDLPILIDETQLIGESLGLVRTGEVFVINPQDWSIAYHGLVDDRLGYETQKPAAKNHYLRDALQSMVKGEAVAVSSTKAVGCLINFPDKAPAKTVSVTAAQNAHTNISYATEIAPMLIENCVSCHRPGGIGPWAMTEYNLVKGFAPMIREVVRTQRMPPWHADPHFGEFDNDRSLTVAQQQKLVHWVEAGAPRGEGPDPLAEFAHDWPEWAMGEPDLVIEIPGHEIPATGTVPYQYQRVVNPHDEDVWVRAVEIIPGDRKALHHVITSFGVPDETGKVDRRRSKSLGGYVPGAIAEQFPDSTGVMLPANAEFTFQMHYTAYGRPAVDNSRLGIYFHKQAPEHELASMIFLNNEINIPAHSNGHTESAARTIRSDMLVYGLLPHAHFRGKTMEFRAVYADGREEVLLSVPHYDFNWQTDYNLSEPKFLPAGTKLVHTTSWDNSATNPANPDPTRDVPWGEQSWDEMLFGAVRWREVTPAEKLALQKGNKAGTQPSAAGGSD